MPHARSVQGMATTFQGEKRDRMNHKVGTQPSFEVIQPAACLRLTNLQHGLDGFAVFGIGNGLVDVYEVIKLLKAIKRELS